jgi:hypothetical protein
MAATISISTPVGRSGKAPTCCRKKLLLGCVPNVIVRASCADATEGAANAADKRMDFQCVIAHSRLRDCLVWISERLLTACRRSRSISTDVWNYESLTLPRLLSDVIKQDALNAWIDLYTATGVCCALCAFLALIVFITDLYTRAWVLPVSTVRERLLAIPRIWLRFQVLYLSGTPVILLIISLYIYHLGPARLLDV